MPVLASDVVDLIVDELRDDETSLRACALAAKMFRSRALDHLFYEVRLLDCSKKLYASFFAVLGAPHMALRVRKLHVSLYPGGRNPHEYGACAYGTQGLLPILPRLARLQELSFSGLSWLSLDVTEQATLLDPSILPELQQLRLWNFEPPNLVFLLKFLRSHRHSLRQISLGNLRYRRRDAEVPRSAFARATGVEVVEFLLDSSKENDSLPFKVWRDVFAWTSLVTLDIRVDDDDDVRDIQGLLEDTCSTLQNIIFRHVGYPENSMHVYDFGRLSSLRTFKYEWENMGWEWPDHTNPLHRMLGFLSTVTSTCFEQAVLDLQDPVHWPDPRDLWLRLGQLVVDRKWRATPRGPPLRLSSHGYFEREPLDMVEQMLLEAWDYVDYCEDVMGPFVQKGLVDIQNKFGTLDECIEVNSY